MWYAIMFDVITGARGGIRIVAVIVHNGREEAVIGKGHKVSIYGKRIRTGIQWGRAW